MKLKKNIAFLLGIFLSIVFIYSCSKDNKSNKPKPEPIEITKVVFENGHVDTLRLTPPVEIEWNTLYSDRKKVANGVGYIKKLN
jgi:hypothetical protein